MADKITVPTPLGPLSAEIGGDADQYPEIYITIGDAQVACIGYYDMLNSVDDIQPRLELRVWNDGGYEDPVQEIRFPGDQVRGWKF